MSQWALPSARISPFASGDKGGEGDSDRVLSDDGEEGGVSE